MWLISYRNILALLYFLHCTKCVFLQKYNMHILVFRPDGPHLQKLHEIKCDTNENVMVIFKLCRRNPILGFPFVWINQFLIFMELLAHEPIYVVHDLLHVVKMYTGPRYLYIQICIIARI